MLKLCNFANNFWEKSRKFSFLSQLLSLSLFVSVSDVKVITAARKTSYKSFGGIQILTITERYYQEWHAESSCIKKLSLMIFLVELNDLLWKSENESKDHLLLSEYQVAKTEYSTLKIMEI